MGDKNTQTYQRDVAILVWYQIFWTNFKIKKLKSGHLGKKFKKGS